jgi:hypothetical protein
MCKELAMFETIGTLVVAAILLALCLTQDQTLDAERDFWIKARKLMDQPSSENDPPHL